jgi:hypothetical protein
LVRVDTWDVVKIVAVLFAAIPALASALATLLVYVIETVPLDNNDGPDAWSFLALFLAAAAFLFALGAVASIIRSQIGYAKAAFGLHATVVTILLAIALRASSHSDGKLVAFTLPVELCGLLGVILAARYDSEHRKSVARS